MTHGYEFFEFDYIDIDLMDWLMSFEEENMQESWQEIKDIYYDYSEDAVEFDVYEQDEEEEEW